jgi:hypothetical protein
MLLKDLVDHHITLYDGRTVWHFVNTLILPCGGRLFISLATDENRQRKAWQIVAYDKTGKERREYTGLDPVQAQCLLHHFTTPGVNNDPYDPLPELPVRSRDA